MIPVSAPLLNGREMDYVREAVESGWISSEGRFIAAFEQRWAEYCGVPHGIAVSNGTVALQLALRALDLPAGSEVILPSCTIISCVLAVLEADCVPVLVDSDPQTWCMNADQVAAKITPRTRVLMPVHLLGHPCDMAPLRELADRHGLLIVEDAAEAHGAEYNGRRCGSLGTLACFSFYANKIITTGEGGMVTTADPVLAERLRAMRNLCFRRDRRFLHTELGFNYRLTNMQAAVGLAQVERIGEHIAIKRRIAARYLEGLHGLPLTLPVERPWARNVYWMFGLVLDDGVPFDADELAIRMRKEGVDSRPFFLGMHEQPILKARGLFEGERYPVAERLARRGVYLPSGLGLGPAQQETVIDVMRQVLA